MGGRPSQGGRRADGRWSVHRSNKKMQKKRVISGSFKVKHGRQQQANWASRFATYTYGDEEESSGARTHDPLVRDPFFVIPDKPRYEHHFDGLEPLQYGRKAQDHSAAPKQPREAAQPPAKPPAQPPARPPQASRPKEGRKRGAERVAAAAAAPAPTRKRSNPRVTRLDASEDDEE
eukprot:Hpha_TRINITY_DN3881_c0_g1::TRINITY_DN3881_c0_g1_i2::g.44699::m.44699